MDYAYSEKGGYFIKSSGLKGIEFRTHPDLIAYVKETDQQEYKIVYFPKGKVFTEIHIESTDGYGGDYYLMIASDGLTKVV
uniref:Uncharacterized protein n=1 Tax=Pithovirus LCPAC401 TaxID=2506595 RepID=A0A481ZBY4_9VIRU|nr:MAG: hypothetical protein LCPAC401_02270 [Pithovirus LCPAC401]